MRRMASAVALAFVVWAGTAGAQNAPDIRQSADAIIRSCKEGGRIQVVINDTERNAVLVLFDSKGDFATTIRLGTATEAESAATEIANERNTEQNDEARLCLATAGDQLSRAREAMLRLQGQNRIAGPPSPSPALPDVIPHPREKRAPKIAHTTPQLFPWPPPVPSATEVLPHSRFGDRKRFSKLKDVAEYLTRQLQEAEYSDLRFYRIKDSGFAILTRLEQINRDGHPLPGAERWPDYDRLGRLELRRPPRSLGEYFVSLFFPEDAHTLQEARYRLFAIAVTPDAIRPNPKEKISTELVRRWVSEGDPTLDRTISEKPFKSSYDVTVLVYEFATHPDKAPELVRPSHLPGKIHVAAAGLSF